ncbi:hypothetical protein [Halorussus sp. MSC15.2]|uniref:hypothetical protein n=1 Tax=Halorussus sp. MSC15.2 TaxID=2283638 RepID=UPI0013D0907F|nr:hypothetical protein [Halorussus sp. MSC15.2]NEU58876.1 hypothetical protein [Halorussus sp. MSC15.2]
MKDSTRYILSTLIGLAASIATILNTGKLYLSLGIGIIVANLIVVISRREVWNWLLYGGESRNEGQFVIAVGTSLMLTLGVSGETSMIGIVHSLTVLLALAVGLSSGMLHERTRNDK